jgi:hypothetical protein
LSEFLWNLYQDQPAALKGSGLVGLIRVRPFKAHTKTVPSDHHQLSGDSERERRWIYGMQLHHWMVDKAAERKSSRAICSFSERCSWLRQKHELSWSIVIFAIHHCHVNLRTAFA